ncbi:MAG: tetratricopeptide repeat protein, partial [Burkholderiaceae bacterium]
ASIEEAARLAMTQFEAGRLAEAETICLRILEQVPEHPEALHVCGAIAHLSGKHGLALALLEKAARLLPIDPQVQYNWGVVLAAIGQTHAARLRYRAALALAPGHSNALRNLGNLAFEESAYAEAARCYAQALVVRPDHAMLHLSLAMSLVALRELDAARDHYERALAQSPEDPLVRWESSLYYLLVGEFARGWFSYEARFAAGDVCKVWHYPFAYARWKGESLAGKHLLIHGEQGFGDEIMFLSLVPELLTRGGRITLVGQPQLESLWRHVFPGCRVRAQARCGDAGWIQRAPLWLDELAGDPPDYQIPFGSLAALLRPNRAAFDLQKPYITIDAARQARWEHWLVERLSSRLQRDALPRRRVGLAWAGAPGVANAVAARKDAQRSIGVASLMQIAAYDGVDWIGLHTRAPAEHQQEIDLRILDCTARLTDFAETAALIANLDLVVTVDTAVAHLAGAMGKPVWILLPFAGEWRWGLDEGRTPWWPTARLFRQDRPGHWDRPIARVMAALAAPEAA